MTAFLLLMCMPALAMQPTSGTAMGVPSQNNSAPYTAPLGGAYYLYSPLGGPSAVWTVTAAAPGFASDPIVGGAAITQLGGGKHAKLVGSVPGWVRVDVWVSGMIVDTAHYRFYKIEVLEDDVGNHKGYDPRYGAASAPFSEEGGFYHATNQFEPAAENILGYDDRLAGELVEWTGAALAQPRGAVPRPEAQLLQSGGPGSLNSLVATRRDDQYVRVWVHGPREPLSFPIYIHCSDFGTGSILPGPQNPGYQIKVYSLTPPPPLAAGGQWGLPTNVTQTTPVLSVQRLLFQDSIVMSMWRHWVVRIPWRGSHTSATYGDIEVEVQIPNPSQIAMQVGADPTGLEEGSMQLRLGTVVELSSIEVKWDEPGLVGQRRYRWYRRPLYELVHQDTVCDPNMVTSALGAKVLFGDAGRANDPASTHVVSTAENTAGLVGDGVLFEETMANVVNAAMEVGADPAYDFSPWFWGEVPEDVHDVWIDAQGASVSVPESVQLEIRGYTGIVPDTIDAIDYDLEPSEASLDTTQVEDIHFINVIADANNDGIVTASDDIDSLEEGVGAPGPILNYDPNAGVAAAGTSPPVDPNLRELRVMFSTPESNGDYAGLELWIEADSNASSLFVWEDDKRQVAVSYDAGNAAWIMPVPANGDDVSVFIGSKVTAGYSTLDFSIVNPGSPGAPSDPGPQRGHMDRIQMNHGQLGLDVDSDNDTVISLHDDKIEEAKPGVILVGPTSRTLRLRRELDAGEYAAGSIVTLSHTGSGQVEIVDDAAATVITTGDSTHVLPIGDVTGSGALDYSLAGLAVGEFALTLEVSINGRVVAYDRVVGTVAQFDIVTPVDANSNGIIDDATPASGLNGNELSYTAATTGVLKLPVHVQVQPDSQAMRKYLNEGKMRLRVSAIDDSHGAATRVSLAWTPYPWEGEATACRAAQDPSDLLWKGTATFTGLPDQNADFGIKAVILQVLNAADEPLVYVDSVPIEVFFEPLASNNSSADPNWFFYYRDLEGGGYTYNSSYSGLAHNIAWPQPVPTDDSNIEFGTGSHSRIFGAGYTTFNHNGPGGGIGNDHTTAWRATPIFGLRYFLAAVEHERWHNLRQIASVHRTAVNDPDADGATPADEATWGLVDGGVANGPGATQHLGFDSGNGLGSGLIPVGTPNTNWPDSEVCCQWHMQDVADNPGSLIDEDWAKGGENWNQ